MIDFVSIASGAVKILGPFLPYLDPFRKALQKKIEDVTANAAWDQAKGLWGKITGRFKDDKELNAVAKSVAENPDIEGFQEMLTKVLARRLESSPDLTKELIELLGGEKRLQEIVAGNEATIDNIRQTMAGAGTQRDRGWRQGKNLWG
jgi:DNA modification methylase